MKLKTLTLAVSALAFAASTVSALADDTYLGAHYAQFTYDESGVKDLNPNVVTLYGGVAYDSGFSVEGRLGFGVSDDTANILGIDVDLDINTLIGVYGKYHFVPEATFSPYLIAGLTYLEVEASAFGISVDEDDTSFSFGIGGNIKVDEKSAINLEYIQYFDEFDNSDTEISALSVGYTYTF